MREKEREREGEREKDRDRKKEREWNVEDRGRKSVIHEIIKWN